MLSSCVIYASHPHRSRHSFLDLSPVPRQSSPNFHGIICFADSHLLSPVVSYRYRNVVGRGVSRAAQPPIFYPPFFHALTNCKFHNPFLLIFIQNARGLHSLELATLLSPSHYCPRHRECYHSREKLKTNYS